MRAISMPPIVRATDKKNQIVGLISDTHGLIRPQALEALAGLDLIIHAGDIGTPEVLAALKAIAPVAAIRGNNDTGAWAKPLPETKLLKVCDKRLYIIHNVKDLAFDPAGRRFDAVISGHSHKPSIARREGVLFVNPGSAGPRRFKLPIAVGKLLIGKKKLEAELIELQP
jgi:putative phosphoesterase